MAEPVARLDTRAEDAHAGRRLDRVLATWMGTSRAAAQRLIAGGLVTVDGQVAAKSARLLAGQRVVARDPDPEPTPTPPAVPIRLEDEHLAVVAKPADLVVHAGAGVRGATLVDALRTAGVPLAAGDDPDRPGIVHRLDRGTSGLLVVAKTGQAMAGLKARFATHDVQREYWTMVEGHPDPAAATIDAPIRRSPRNRTIFTTGEDGRPAVTHYATTAIHPGLAELAVTLETGRTHQVRVHLRAVGRPVAGDTAYGASTALSDRLGLIRPALHARRLGFLHPVTGERIEVIEPLPDDLREARELAAAGVGGR